MNPMKEEVGSEGSAGALLAGSMEHLPTWLCPLASLTFQEL